VAPLHRQVAVLSQPGWLVTRMSCPVAESVPSALGRSAAGRVPAGWEAHVDPSQVQVLSVSSRGPPGLAVSPPVRTSRSVDGS